MKEKLVKLLKSIGLLLVVGSVIAISVRLFTIVRVISSNEPMNQSLLPETFGENLKWEAKKVLVKTVKDKAGLLREKADGMNKLIQQLQKQSQLSQLKEVLLLRGEVNKFSDKVDEMKEFSQQLPEQPELQQLEEVSRLENRFSFLWGEFREIQARIQKLEKEIAPVTLPEKKPE